VDFGTGEFEELIVKGYAEKGGNFEIRLNAPDGPRLTDVEFDNAVDHQLKNVTLSDLPKGIHDLYIFNTGDSELILDWIQFK
jgi:hypothetical protein